MCIQVGGPISNHHISHGNELVNAWLIHAVYRPRSKSGCQAWAGYGCPSTTRQAAFKSICAKLKGFFCQAPTKASLPTRPMMALVGICPVNKASMPAVLDPMARVKCLVTTWASGYLAPEAIGTFSRRSCSEGPTLTCVLPGWPPQCVHEFPAWPQSP